MNRTNINLFRRLLADLIDGYVDAAEEHEDQETFESVLPEDRVKDFILATVIAKGWGDWLIERLPHHKRIGA